MPELCVMQSTPSLPLLSSPHCPGLVVFDMILSIGQIELKFVLMLNGLICIKIEVGINLKKIG